MCLMASWADFGQGCVVGTGSEAEGWVQAGRAQGLPVVSQRLDRAVVLEFWSQESWVWLLQMREPRLTERRNDLPRVTPFKQAKASKPKFGKEFDV